MLTHYNVTANILQLTHPQFLDFYAPDSCVLGVLPFYHIYGMVCILCICFYQGAPLVVLPKFEPALFLSSLKKYSVTDTFLAPPLVLFLAKHPIVDDYKISTLRHITCSAAPLDGELSRQAMNRLGTRILRQGYGCTELSPVCHLNPRDVDNLDTIGVPIQNTQVKIVDVDSGKAVGPHCRGEVTVKGPQVCFIDCPLFLCIVVLQNLLIMTFENEDTCVICPLGNDLDSILTKSSKVIRTLQHFLSITITEIMFQYT